MSDFNQERALHEASHCVAGWFAGFVIGRVTIVGPRRIEDAKGRDVACYCEVRQTGSALNEVCPEDVLSKMIFLICPHVVWPSHGSLLEIYQVMRGLTWAEEPPLRRFTDEARRAMKRHPDDWQKAAKAFFRKCGKPIRQFVEMPNVKRAIEAVAEALVEKGSLSGSEAVKTIESVWIGRLPPKAKPKKNMEWRQRQKLLKMLSSGRNI